MLNKTIITAILFSTFLFSQNGFTQNKARILEELYHSLALEEAIRTGNAFLQTPQQFSPGELVQIHYYTGLANYQLGRVDSAQSHFLSILSLNPQFELNPVEVSPKLISFFNDLKRQIAKEASEQSRPVIYNRYIFIEDKRPAAAWRSAILPGLGQIYKNQRTKGYVTGGLFLGSLMATGIALYQEKRMHEAYLDATTPQIIEEKYSTYNRWYKSRRMLTIVTISVWTFSFLDALWAPYENPRISFSSSGTPLFTYQIRF